MEAGGGEPQLREGDQALRGDESEGEESGCGRAGFGESEQPSEDGRRVSAETLKPERGMGLGSSRGAGSENHGGFET